MIHYIKIFIAFLTVNYLLVFVYDNYYLVNVESEYLLETRDQLRSYALDIRKELTTSTIDKELLINQWASEYNIPSQILLLDKIRTTSDIVIELASNDYIIDLYAEMGPTVYVKINPEQVIEIGPLDPLVIESTTYQPAFILLHLFINGLTACILYLSFRQKTERVESALLNIIDRKGISHETLGMQDVLHETSKRLLVLDNYIQEVEESNLQVVDDQRDLMHAVAHELRSPIARISFALELIEDEYSSPENRKLLKEMHDSIDELEALIKEILSYSRLSHGKMELNKESFDLINLLNSLTARLQSLYPQQSLEVLNEDKEILINADRRLLERAIINLLRNAARFAKLNVNITIERWHESVKIIIDDDGVGIPPGKRERIFEAFTRLDPSRSRDSGGVGLGLAIVKKIVEKHQGKINVSDSPSGGARFIVELPLV